MSKMLLKTVACALIALMMAVLLGGHLNEPMTEGETVFEGQEVSHDAEPPRSTTLPRRVVKRWAHVLILRSRRRRYRLRSALIQHLPRWSAEHRRLERQARRLFWLGAVRRFLGAPRRLFDEWRESRIKPQCADCGVHQDDGYAVDVTLRCRYTGKIEPLCIDCHLENEEHAEMMRNLPNPFDDSLWIQATEQDLKDAFGSHDEPQYDEHGEEILSAEEREAFRRSRCGWGLVGGFLMPLCAAAVLAIFAPQWVAFAFVGAVRQPLPQWAKQAKKVHGVKIRRHETGRKTVACAACMNGIESGDIKAMLTASGYAQKKPHCAPCAQTMLAVPASTPEPTPAPIPEPSPEPQPSRPKNRKADTCAVCAVDVKAGAGFIHAQSPRGQKVRCSAHAETPHGEPAPSSKPTPSEAIKTALEGGSNADKAAQLVALLSTLGGVDEDAVRRIVTDETDELKAHFGAIATTAALMVEQAEERALEAVQERLNQLNAPVVLHIKTDDNPAIPAADEGEIIHRQEREVLAKISALTKRDRAQNIMLIGEPGTGKTHMGEGVHKRLVKVGFFKGMEKHAFCHVESCNEEKQPSDLMGRLSPAFFDDGSGTPAGAWRFFAGAVMKAFTSPSTLVFDEIDTLAPPSFSALNAMLANGFIIDPDGVKHYRHPRCVVIATANTRGNGADENYTASHAQSLASLDRFAAGFVDVDFDPAIEDALAPTLSEDIRTLRELAKTNRCRRVVFSYRVMMNAEAQAQDFGKDYALSETVFQFGAENAAMLGFPERVPLPDDADMSGLKPMSAKARRSAEKVRKASHSLQSFNADAMTETNNGGAA